MPGSQGSGIAFLAGAAMRKPTVDEASGVCLPFGKHRGKSLDDIASDDDGLIYLDWLVGQTWVRTDLKDALEVYMGQKIIQEKLSDI